MKTRKVFTSVPLEHRNFNIGFKVGEEELQTGENTIELLQEADQQPQKQMHNKSKGGFASQIINTSNISQ